jgi:signal transduction histidine kinase
MTRNRISGVRSFSLFGRMALLIAGALLIAQVIGFFMLLDERNSWQTFQAPSSSVAYFAHVAQSIVRASPGGRAAMAFQYSGFGVRYMLTAFDEVTLRHLPRQRSLEQQLTAALRNAGAKVLEVNASSVGYVDSPPSANLVASPTEAQQTPREKYRSANARQFAVSPTPPFVRNIQEITLSARMSEGGWLNGEFLLPPAPPPIVSNLLETEFVLYCVVLGMSLLIAARFIRPLQELGAAASRFGVHDYLDPIPLRGSREVRAAIGSFNSMTRRVTDLLHEKDRMIAALGHDLRTPLASMRVRAEGMEPAPERRKMIETLEETAQIVEDILCLARPVLASEPFTLVDLSALAEVVVDEFRELGKNATFSDAPRAPVRMQSTAVKRMLRNLVENAIKFGGQATVSIESRPEIVFLCVDDEGPGIPEALLCQVTEAFVRVEQSRNRETGGLGLGLSIATAIARTQGARLDLMNRENGGFRARISWKIPA